MEDGGGGGDERRGGRRRPFLASSSSMVCTNLLSMELNESGSCTGVGLLGGTPEAGS